MSNWDCGVYINDLYEEESLTRISTRWKDSSSLEAAEAFAKDAYENMDMWEAGPTWEVYVKPSNRYGPPERFLITVEFNPTFSASKPEELRRRTREAKEKALMAEYDE